MSIYTQLYPKNPVFQSFFVIFVVSVVYFAIDMYLWFPNSGKVYQNSFNRINGTNFFYMRRDKWFIGALVWLIGGIAIWRFVSRSKKPLVDGAILGFSIYSIYNFTNYFLFKNYSSKVVIVDTIYGTILFSLLGLLSKRIS